MRGESHHKAKRTEGAKRSTKMSLKTDAGKCLASDIGFPESQQQAYLQQYAGYQLDYAGQVEANAAAVNDEYQMPSFQQQQTSSHPHYHQPDQTIAISSGSYSGAEDDTLYTGASYQQEWQPDRCQPSVFASQQVKTEEPDYNNNSNNNNNNSAGYLNFQQQANETSNYQAEQQVEHSSFQQQPVYSSNPANSGYQPQEVYYDYENQTSSDRNSNFLISSSSPSVIQQQQQRNYENECFQPREQHHQHQYQSRQANHYEEEQQQQHGDYQLSPVEPDTVIVTPQRVSSRTSTRRGRPRKKGPKSKNKVNGKLWEFIRDLLLSERTNPSFIRWERREDGVFKFVQSDKVAKMWGERKQNPKMTYEKLSRAMRYYYKSKVLLPVFGRRLVYKFGPNATGWMPSDATY